MSKNKSRGSKNNSYWNADAQMPEFKGSEDVVLDMVTNQPVKTSIDVDGIYTRKKDDIVKDESETEVEEVYSNEVSEQLDYGIPIDKTANIVENEDVGVEDLYIDPATKARIKQFADPSKVSTGHYLHNGSMYVYVDSTDSNAVFSPQIKEVAYFYRFKINMAQAGIEQIGSVSKLMPNERPKSKLSGLVYRAVYKLTLPI